MSKLPSPAKPSAAAGSSRPTTAVGQPQGLKKLRKKKRAANLNRALDEFDDVDESDLVAGPSKRQRTRGFNDDADLGEDGSDDDEDDDGDQDGDGDVDDAQHQEQDMRARGNEVQKDVDPNRLEKINTKRKKQA